MKLNITIGVVSAACRLRSKKRYEALRSSRLKFGKLLPFRPLRTYSSLMRQSDLETAFRLQAEICIAQGGLFSSKKWKERVLLAGAISAHLGDIDRASNWLAAGVNLQRSSLLARAKTYGLPEEFVSWIIAHQGDIETPSGWRYIFKQHATPERKEALLLYISCLVIAMGLPAYVKPLLSRPTSSTNNALRQAILIRAAKRLPKSERIFDAAIALDGNTDQVVQRIASNIVNRVFDKIAADEEPISAQEMTWLAANENRLPYDEPGFHLATQAVHLIVRRDFAECIRVLSEVVSENQASINLLDARLGPKKIFIGGFGWSGSGAVYDALRGYPSVAEMPGPKHAPFVNDGAESEPMLYQGPAAIMKLAHEFQQRGSISRLTWKKFFALQILTENHSDYFQYKTVWANRNIRETIGSKSYYSVVNQLLFDYASYQLSASSAKNNGCEIASKKTPNPDIFVAFGQRIVNLLFPNDTSIVLFNNAINTHKLEALKFTGGRSHYIAVDRSILDQMADQRKNNIFFRFSVVKFAFYKIEKLYHFRKYKKSVPSMNDVTFIETTFENWVGRKEYRKQLAETLIGFYDEDHERRHFRPEESAKNIGISKKILSAFEIRVLSVLQALIR